MKSLIKLFNDWEIQLLVLLSFTLQLFLFFVGNLRWRWTNMCLRFLAWMAYLGADLIAVYALGYLSRHVDATTGRDTLRGTHPLAFFWAPFLLVHLGGQDTITAFSMEDNNLWLRHSLNMVVQVVLAIYIFWLSMGRHSMELIISGIFLFVAGFIKYGERIWSLRCGNLENLESSSTGTQYRLSLDLWGMDFDYHRTVGNGLCLMPKVLEVLTGRSFDIFDEYVYVRTDELLKLVGFELGILHSDLYTKALVLRARSGIILRCISQVAMVVAFVMFLNSGNKHSYHRADIAITYSLFIGAFFLEVCALFIFLMSPWTWVWFKARGCNMLARVAWCLLSNDAIGWSEKRPLWSNVIGQYNLRDWLVDNEQPRSFCQYLMFMVRKLWTIFGAQDEKLFWLSKLLGRDYTKADRLLECLQNKMLRGFSAQDGPGFIWRHHLKSIFMEESESNDFGNLLIMMHISTEVHLRRYYYNDSWYLKEASGVSVEVCQQLSRYMMYLFVTHPSLLPLDRSAAGTLQKWRADVSKFDLLNIIHNPQISIEALEEFEDSWIWIIMYTAAKSRPEMHAALLARGGEPLTFVWLMLAHLRFGSERMSGLSWYRKIDRNNDFINTGIPQLQPPPLPPYLPAGMDSGDPEMQRPRVR